MKTLSDETKQAVVSKLAVLMQDKYAFPNLGAKMKILLENNLAEGRYEEIKNASALCRQLTEDLRSIERDYHLTVYAHPAQAAALKELAEDPDRKKGDDWALTSEENFGFKKLEHLPGNIGYADLRQFPPVNRSAPTAAAMMAFFANCDALIFDLRWHGGGDPYLVQFIESYFFDEPAKLLLTMYDRPSDTSEEIRVIPVVPGKRMPEVPIYILTSGVTFSGGEDFAYTMKHHKRATIVGETTGGGAHPVDFMWVYEDVIVCLPTGYPTHPETGTNWEGTGVESDLKVSREEALAAAHLHALDTLINNCEDEDRKTKISWKREEVQVSYQPVPVEESLLRSYVGVYDTWEIVFRDGVLYANRRGRDNFWELTPLSENYFVFDGDRIRFETDTDGVTLEFVMEYGQRRASIRKA